MKKSLILVLIFVLSIFMISCKAKNPEVIINTQEIEEAIEVDLEGITEEVKEVEEKEKEEVNVIDDGKIYSKITGLEITEEESKIRPIAVMLDNQFRARPQAGLSDAEVVYEILAEGSITRYMAIFQVNKPEVVGPVRSSRPYYIVRALEFNPLYVHVGGSMQALADIKGYKMGDIDGMSVAAGVFYRTTHKNMPHNAYTSNGKIRKEADRKGHYTEVEFAGMPISNKVVALEGKQANSVIVQYKKSSAKDAIGYSINFQYDEENKDYLRYVNGEKHLDEETKIHLRTKNIIIQKVGHKVIDNEGRKQLDMISKGDGYYIYEGVYIDITWEKIGVYDQTKYFYKDGSELILNPGVTWIEVIKKTNDPYIE